MCSSRIILFLFFFEKKPPSKFGLGSRCLNSNKYGICMDIKNTVPKIVKPHKA